MGSTPQQRQVMDRYIKHGRHSDGKCRVDACQEPFPCRTRRSDEQIIATHIIDSPLFRTTVSSQRALTNRPAHTSQHHHADRPATFPSIYFDAMRDFDPRNAVRRHSGQRMVGI